MTAMTVDNVEHLPLCRNHSRLSTDVTITGQPEFFSPPTSGADDFPEIAASLAYFSLRLPAAQSTKGFWCPLIHAQNEAVQLPDLEAADEQLDYGPDPVTTETTFAPRRLVLTGPPRSFFLAGGITEMPRGTFAVAHPRDVIFSEELELRVHSLPRWRPFVRIDRRSMEPDDE